MYKVGSAFADGGSKTDSTENFSEKFRYAINFVHRFITMDEIHQNRIKN